MAGEWDVVADEPIGAPPPANTPSAWDVVEDTPTEPAWNFGGGLKDLARTIADSPLHVAAAFARMSQGAEVPLHDKRVRSRDKLNPDERRTLEAFDRIDRGEGFSDLATRILPSSERLVRIYRGADAKRREQLRRSVAADIPSRVIRLSDDLAKQRSTEPGGKQKFLPGINRQDVRDLSQNLAFAATGSAAGLAVGIPAGAVSTPVGGMAAGSAASGVAAYRQDENMFMRQVRDAWKQQFTKDRGREPTDREWVAKRNEVYGLARKHGLFEAIFQALGNFGELEIIVSPLKKILGKSVLKRVLGKVAGVYGTEIATETLTQTGQHNIEFQAGVGPGPERSFLSVPDYLQSAKEVAPQVVLLTALMGGAAAGTHLAYSKAVTAPREKRVSQILQGAVREGRLDLISDDDLAAIIENASDVAARRPKDAGLAQAVDALKAEQARRNAAPESAQWEPITDLPAEAVPQEAAPAASEEPAAEETPAETAPAQETPGEVSYFDPRLKRDDYRYLLDKVVKEDFVPRGGVALVPDENHVAGESMPRGETPLTRTPSLNAQWIQELLADTGMSVNEVRRAAEKALAGEPLGVRQAKAVRGVLDFVTGERTSPANIEAARDELHRARDLRRYMQARLANQQEVDQLASGAPLPEYGELYKESEYAPELNALQRVIAEIADEARQRGGDPGRVESILERQAPDAEVLRDLVAYNEGLKSEAQGQQATQEAAAPERGPEGAAPAVPPERQGESLPATPPAGEPLALTPTEPGPLERASRASTETQTDIFGGVSPTAQAVRDAEIARRRAIDGAPAIEAGPGELFNDGSRQADVEDVTKKTDPAAEVDRAANEAATSPRNALPQPTEAQKEAGNYQKGHIALNGLDISIENPRGSRRRPEWPPLKSHYGYILGTVGKDKEHLDVFLGPDARNANTPVYVVDQVDPKTGAFDEHKVMMGFPTEAAARRGYLENYTPGWKGLGAIKGFTLDEFKQWLNSGNTRVPVALQTSEEKGNAKEVRRDQGQPQEAHGGTRAKPEAGAQEGENARRENLQRNAEAGRTGGNEPSAQAEKPEQGAAGERFPVADILKAAGLTVRKTTTKNGNPVWEVSGTKRGDHEKQAIIKSLGGRWYGPKKVWSFYKGDPTEALAARLPKPEQTQTAPIQPTSGEGTQAPAEPSKSTTPTAESGGIVGAEESPSGPAEQEHPEAGNREGNREARPARGESSGSLARRVEEPGTGTRELGETGGEREEPSRAGGEHVGRREGGGTERTPSGSRDHATLRPQRSAALTRHDYTITDADELGAGGAKTKYRQNVAAIRLLKQIEEDDRFATPEEQAVLAKYVGWGGLKGVFDPENKEWAKEHFEIKELLGKEEYEAARRSILDAHYTSVPIVRAIWSGLQRLGFSGGHVLEPSVGAGNFIGLMPKAPRSDSDFVGVELDRITGGIARQLYQHADIITPRGFQEVDLPSNSFDVAVGNPPFGSQKLFDSRHPEFKNFSIHNYFFAKSLDKVRPGGVLAMVVSRYFMDAQASEARAWIAERTRLISAIRLPYTAFKGNANTEVVTDILFLQKLREGETADKSWAETGAITVGGNKFSLNKYFIKNKGQVLGEITRGGTMYSAGSITVEPSGDWEQALRDRIAALPENVYEKATRPVESPVAEAVRSEASQGIVPATTKVGAYFVTPDGALAMRLEDSASTDKEGAQFRRHVLVGDKPAATQARIRGLIKVREALRDLIRAELTQQNDTGLAPMRAKLNREYAGFVKKHGYINALGNRRAFQDDPDLPLLESLEPGYDPGVSSATAKTKGIAPRAPKAGKAAIFEKRVLSPYVPVSSAETPKDALVASLNEHGKVDVKYMSDISGVDPDTLTRELSGLIYRNPETDQFETADEYLTGNVKAKLAAATSAAQEDPAYRANVEALKAVQPAFVPAADISVRLGSSWVPADVVEGFAKELLGGEPRIAFVKAVGRWSVNAKGSGTAYEATWGTARVRADKVLESILNLNAIVVKDNVGTARDPVYVVNDTETQAARAKADDMQQKFKDWVWLDAPRRERLEQIYNDVYNTNRVRTFDGSHLTLPGLSPDITLRKNQKDGIWRIIQDRQTLLDHVVGAGKTYTMVGAAMELRRLGIARKPIIAVPNHLVRQWRDEFYKAYPNANILATTEKDFEKGNRQKLFSRIATGDWDAVIVAHSSFKKIGMPEAEEQAILNEMLTELSNAIEEIKRERGDRHIIRDMERIKENLDGKMARLKESGGKKDKAVAFDELGADALFVDEAHLFKNLFYFSQMKGVAGLGSPAGSGRAFDLFVKIRYLQNRFGGRGITVFGTGTPVSNSLVEMFTMQRYLMYDDLKAREIHLLDSWARVFGDVQQVYEVHPSGSGYRLATRFAKFVNLPELMTLYRKFSDVITLDDLKAQARAEGKRFPVPKIKGGKPQIEVAERSPMQTNFFGTPQFSRGPGGEILFRHNNLGVASEEGKWFVTTDGGTKIAGPLESENDAKQERNRLMAEPVVGYNEGSILWKFEHLRELTKKTDGKVNALSITNEARKAGLDYRLIDPNSPDFEGSKINRAVVNLVRIWKEWEGDKGTQLIFCDLSVPASARRKVRDQAQAQAGREEADSLTEDRDTETTQSEDAAPAEEEEKISMDQLLATQSSFSVYDDIKAKLIAAGVPTEQIAFIHDYDTADKKAKLFRDVNDGRVRFLLGSTEKLGAGTNVQERLVAEHHLDAPWRPSDLEQREGRIIRQGNKLFERDPDGFEVEIHRYATKQTYDTRMWQLIEHKARGVEQLRRADETARTIDDISGEAANASDMKAAASGNPLILEEIKLRTEMRSLEAQEKNYLRTLFDLQGREQNLRLADQRHAAATSQLKPWFDLRAAHPVEKAENFSIEIGGKKYSDKKNISGPINAKFVEAAKAIGQTRIEAGVYRGVHFAFRVGTDGKSVTAYLSHNGKDWNTLTVYDKGDEFSAQGLLTRIDNFLARLESDQQMLDRQLGRDKDELSKVRAELNKPFAKQGLLNEARAKHREVVQKLQAAGGGVQLSAEMKAELDDAVKRRRSGEPSDEDLRFSSATSPAPLGAEIVEPRKPMTAAEITKGLTGITSKWKNAPEIRIVDHIAQSPPEIFDSAIRFARHHPDGLQRGLSALRGLFYSKNGHARVYLFANNLYSIEDAQRTMLHEVVGHYGLRGALGDSYNNALDEIWKYYGEKGLADLAQHYDYDLSTLEGRRRTADEQFARLAERFGNKQLHGRELSLFERIIQALRRFLRSIGFKLDMNRIEWGLEVVHLMNSARRFVESGKASSYDQPVSFSARPREPDQLQGLRDDKVVAVAVPKANGSWEIYWGRGASLLQSQEFRRQPVASYAQARQIMERAGLALRLPRPTSVQRPSTPTLFNGFDVPAEDVRDYLIRKAQDRFRRVKIVQRAIARQGGVLGEDNDTYLAEELYYGRTADKIDRFREQYVDPLVEAMRDEKVGMEEIDQYLYAKHAPERNAKIAEINPYFRENEIAGSGMSDEEAQSILDGFDADGQTEALERIAKMVYEVNDARLALLEREGLESKETIKLWTEPYKYYVPLRGFEAGSEANQLKPRTGRGYDIRGKESRRALGRGSRALSPLTFTVAQMEESIIRAEKNRVGRTFLKLVQSNPNPMLWEINKVEVKPRYDERTGEVVYGPDPMHRYADNVFSVKVDGKQVLVTIHDDLMARAMKNLGADHSNKFISTLATLNRFLAMVNTSLNPEFVLSNFTRDIQTAMINLYGEQGASEHSHLRQPTGIARRVLKDVPGAMAGVYASVRGVDSAVFGLAKRSETVTKWSRWHDEFAAAGGKVGFFGLQSIESKRKALHRALRHAEGGTVVQAEKVFTAAGELIMDVNTAVENAVRLAAYKNARELGFSQKQAASLAKNLTVNFNRKGELGLLMNAMYLFYNASIQGSARLIYAVRSPKVRKLMLGIVVGAFLMAELNRVVGGDDDDGVPFYDKIDPWIKEHNFIIMKADGKGGYYSFPLPYGYNVPHVVGSGINEIVHSGNPAKVATRTLIATMDAFNPMGSDAGLVQMISPTITDPIVQIATNENFYGAPIKPEQRDHGPKRPESQLYWNTVSPVSKAITTKLNELTGGNTVRPGAIDLSPEVLDFLVSQYFGGAGAFVNRSVNAVASLAKGEEIPDRKIPFLRRFVGQQSEYALPRQYYQNLNEVQLAHEEYRTFLKRGERDKARASRERYSNLYRLYGAAKTTDEALQAIHRRIREINEARSIPEDAKDKRVTNLRERARELMSRFNKRYNEATAQ